MAESSPPDPSIVPDDATRLERGDGTSEQADHDNSKLVWWTVFERITGKLFPPPVHHGDEVKRKQYLAGLLGRELSDLSADSGLVTTARERFRRDFEIFERAERRAAALLGTLPIAATFTLAGGALILDGARTCGVMWRIPLALAFLLPVIALTAAAWFSALAVVRRQPLHHPDEESVRKFAEEVASEAWRNYVLELLTSADLNKRVRDWKVARVRTATFCFELALLGILLAGLVMAAYVIVAPTS